MLADAAREGVLGILCLGDLVGYGADPIACVETLGERAVAAVAGNHEHGGQRFEIAVDVGQDGVTDDGP